MGGKQHTTDLSINHRVGKERTGSSIFMEILVDWLWSRTRHARFCLSFEFVTDRALANSRAF